jgi:hypothetical protein
VVFVIMDGANDMVQVGLEPFHTSVTVE